MSITKQEYRRRRTKLMSMMEPNGIAIIPSAQEKIRSHDTEYPFRQDSDFFYLTGFNEPHAVAVVIPGREHGEFVLFCRDRDRAREIWDGYRAGPQGGIDDFNADDAFPIDDIDDILPGLIEGKNRVYYTLGKDPEFDNQVMTWVNAIRANARSGATPPGEFLDLDLILHDMRLYKSAAEIKIMRRAGQISAEAHIRAMKLAKTAKWEYQLESEILHEFGMQGARYPAYNTIVGSGSNGCILHYVENADKLKKGDLVLIDAGCEYEGYAADITRTFPVSGKFTEPQRALYELVLKAQFAALEEVKPGNHWNAPHEVSVKVITAGLIELGLLDGSLEDNVEKETYKNFYMHRIGHWIGIDVHDVGDYKVSGEWRLLEPGMVMTIEPGIYVAEDNDSVDSKWRGIGIRIEDDVLITEDGCEVFTDGAPKTVEAIEELMAV